MNSVKENLHMIIEHFDDEEFLKSVYEILKEKEGQQPGAIWDSLSPKQQNEVLQAVNEIDQPLKQTSHAEMVKKNHRWLKK
jgi:hypothetical protein